MPQGRSVALCAHARVPSPVVGTHDWLEGIAVGWESLPSLAAERVRFVRPVVMGSRIAVYWKLRGEEFSCGFISEFDADRNAWTPAVEANDLDGFELHAVSTGALFVEWTPRGEHRRFAWFDLSEHTLTRGEMSAAPGELRCLADNRDGHIYALGAHASMGAEFDPATRQWLRWVQPAPTLSLCKHSVGAVATWDREGDFVRVISLDPQTSRDIAVEAVPTGDSFAFDGNRLVTITTASISAPYDVSSFDLRTGEVTTLQPLSLSTDFAWTFVVGSETVVVAGNNGTVAVHHRSGWTVESGGVPPSTSYFHTPDGIFGLSWSSDADGIEFRRWLASGAAAEHRVSLVTPVTRLADAIAKSQGAVTVTVKGSSVAVHTWAARLRRPFEELRHPEEPTERFAAYISEPSIGESTGSFDADLADIDAYPDSVLELARQLIGVVEIAPRNVDIEIVGTELRERAPEP